MFGVFLAGSLIAGWLHLGLLTGLSFAAGSVLAAGYTRRDSLLMVVTTPPVIFAVAVIGTEALTSQADTARHTLVSVAEGTFLTLTAVAPWLLGGMAATLAVATARGLPQCVRDLRAALRGDASLLGAARPAGARPAGARPAGAQPAGNSPGSYSAGG